VQAQTLSFSIQNNSTHLLITTNAFAFTGVIFDVVGAFLALLSSTQGQAHTDRIDILYDELSSYAADELIENVKVIIEYLGPAPRPSLLVYDFLVKANTRVENLGMQGGDRSQLGANGIDSQLRPRRSGALQVVESAEKIVTLGMIGDAAGIATVLGILCFLISVVCLAKATQPPSVWIPAIAASSCIVILPVLNKLLSWI